MILILILTLSLISGQLAKLPFFSYGGITLIDVVVILLTTFYLIKSRFYLKKRPQFLLAALLFVIVCLLSLAFTPLHLQPVEYLTSLFYTVRFASFMTFGYLVYTKVIFKSARDLEKVLIYSGIGLALLGILQLIFFPSLEPIASYGWDPHVDRVVSTFLDPNFLAAYLTITLILIYLNPHKILKPRLRITFFGLVYLAFLGTFSRGGYVMFSVSFILITLFLRNLKTAVITILLLLGLAGGYGLYKVQVATPHNVNRTASAELRISSWEQGQQIFLHAPILGVGFNTYRYALGEYQLASNAQLQSRGGTSNDSSLLFVSATTGVIGLLIYLGFLFLILKLGWQLYHQKNSYGVIIITAIFGLLSQSFFSNLLFYPFILFLLFSIASLGQRDLK